MTKAIFINDELHHAAKMQAYGDGVTIVRLVETAIAKHIEAAQKQKASVVTRPINIAPARQGRPPNKKETFSMPMIEVQAMERTTIPDYLEPRAETVNLFIRMERKGVWFSPMDIQTAGLCQIAGHDGLVPAIVAQQIMLFHGEEALVSVTENYEPLNSMAHKILALMPGREKFSKYLLAILNDMGFSVVYHSN